MAPPTERDTDGSRETGGGGRLSKTPLLVSIPKNLQRMPGTSYVALQRTGVIEHEVEEELRVEVMQGQGAGALMGKFCSGQEGRGWRRQTGGGGRRRDPLRNAGAR